MNKVTRLKESLLRHRFGENTGPEGLNRVFSKEWVDEMNKMALTPEGRKILQDRIDNARKFSFLAKDPIQDMANEVSAYLSPDASWYYAMEYYQRDLKSKTMSGYDTLEGEFDPETGEVGFSIDDWDHSTQMFGGAGIVADHSRFASPERQLEVYDMLVKLVNHKSLNKDDKLVLLTYLFLGTGPGDRSYSNSSHYRVGTDIDNLLRSKDVPKEWHLIKDRLKKLDEYGVPYSRSTILEAVDEYELPPLISSRRQLNGAPKRIQAAAMELFDAEDMESFASILLGESEETITILGEAKSPAEIASLMKQFLDGKKLPTKDIISLIVAGVASNIQEKTLLTKSKIFRSNSFAGIVREYLKLAKSNNPYDNRLVTNMLILPGLEKRSKEAKSYIRKHFK